ncbi:MAG: EamA family transporter, partial [Bryobacterales bacterium]|nr:EamA family transporter [Bryobacterales bacterium]
ELSKLKDRNPSDWQRKILERFDRLIKKHGVLHLLKKGLAVDDAFFALMYPAPLASSAAKVRDNFAANIFSVTRQVRYSQTNPAEEIDVVLFINGLPLITMELKNAWTGQTARYHGQKQYRDGRDATQPLLQFGRALLAVVEAAVFVVAFRYLPLADTHAIAATSPLIVIALGVLFLGEKAGAARWGAVAAGFVGMILIVRPGFRELDWVLLI